jgi:hypothetical protein
MKKQASTDNATKHGAETQLMRPYQPPAILSRERLESAANVCTGFGLKNIDEPSPYGGACGQLGIQS